MTACVIATETRKVTEYSVLFRVSVAIFQLSCGWIFVPFVVEQKYHVFSKNIFSA